MDELRENDSLQPDSEADALSEFAAYLSDSGIDPIGLPLITQEQEHMLAQLAETGNTHAREVLVNAHLRLVISLAKKYENQGVPMENLIQEGNWALHQAVEKFDHNRGIRFSIYAAFRVRHSIQRLIKPDGYSPRSS